MSYFHDQIKYATVCRLTNDIVGKEKTGGCLLKCCREA